MVRTISKYYNHKIWLTKLGNPIINLLFKINIIKKVFGDLYYEQSMSTYDNYQINNFEKSVKLTEGV